VRLDIVIKAEFGFDFGFLKNKNRVGEMRGVIL